MLYTTASTAACDGRSRTNYTLTVVVRSDNCVREMLHQQRPVWQPSKNIMLRHVPHPGLCLLPVGDVMGDAHRTQNFTLPIFYRYLRHHDPGFASQQRGLNLRNARTRVSQNPLHAVELCRGTNRGIRRKNEVWIAQVNLGIAHK